MFDPIEKLKEYVRHPSVSADSKFKDGMAGAQSFLSGIFKSMGFTVDIVPTELHPVVVAKRRGRPDRPHVIIYGHYDVQPPDPLAKWETPPFEPVIRGERIYGRGTADNKGPLMVHITAVARLLEKNPDFPLNITFVVEGEEEIGSKNFKSFLKSNKHRLDGDFIYLSDSGIQTPDQMIVTVGLRGMVAFEVEFTGPRTDLHSGMHGGVLLNPLQALAELAASLHTPDGRVNIPGFYRDVVEPEPWERAQLKKAGLKKADYAKFLGISKFHTPPGYTPFEAIRFLPTLEFNGFSGGYQGEGTKTVIPSKASCKITCRLVPNQTPEKIKKLVFAAIRKRVPKEVSITITDQHDATPYVVIPPDRSNTPKNQPPAMAKCFRALDAAGKQIWGKPPLYLREGGSVGLLADLKSVLGLDAVMMGLFLPEDNLHAPNESFHLGVMKKGIDTSERVLAALAE
ncbi:MAG TPA: M20/M25/M40 family metallo-hydrolase [Candidatus Didemnitutus sp.]|nr:M20/M25/M40 family metallo-hydrolase [Candidatus Didemnitutus sp.]